MLIVKAGGNDINGMGIEFSKTAEDTAEKTIEYLQKLKSEINVPIYFIGMGVGITKDTKSITQTRKDCNARVKAFCDASDWVTFIDIMTPWLATGDGVTPDESLYLGDGVHLNPQGYSVIIPVIQAAIGVTGKSAKSTADSLADYSFYTFDKETAADTGTSKNDGTAIGNVQYTTGKSGKGIALDGSNYIKIDADSLNSDSGLTVGFWMKVSSLQPNADKVNRIISTGLWGGGETGVMLGTYSKSLDKISNFVSGVGSASPSLVWSNDLPYIADNAWHYVTGVFDEEKMSASIYLDGAKVSDYAIPSNGTTLTTCVETAIGGYLDLAGTFNEGFVGSLDEVVIIKSVFSPEYIGKLMNGELLKGSDPQIKTPAVFDFNDKTAGGAAIKGNATFTNGRSGHSGDYAIKLDGHSYIELDMESLPMNGSFTVSFWINMDNAATSYNSTQRVFSTGVWGAGEGGVALGVYNFKNASESWSKLVSGVGSNSPSFNWTEAAKLMADSTWHHVAASFNKDKRSYTVYFDGVSVGTYQYPADGNTSSSYLKTAIGGHLYTDGSFSEGFIGSLDDINILSSALSANQIVSLMKNNTINGVPNTGDDNNGTIYWATLLLCCVIIAGCLGLKRIAKE